MNHVKISFWPVVVCLCFTHITCAKSRMDINPLQLNTEDNLSNSFNPQINQFWQDNIQSSLFIGVDNEPVYSANIKTGNDKAIVIVQGRNESSLKYKELAYDLNQQGYDLFFIDHRGQGYSTRLGGDKHRGHVEYFSNYVTDFKQYVDSLELEKHYQYRYLLSHSMGGTVSALYLQNYQTPFQASAFFSPMFSIDLGGLPESIAKIISYSSAEVCSWFTKQACYAPGSGGYQAKTFDGNDLSSSQKRFDSAFLTFETSPKTQLGGPTMRWLATSISATQQAIENADKIKIPMILVQAGADTVVTAEGQQQFFDNVTFCNEKQLLHIPDAKHEILFEQDQFRLPALTAALQLFQLNQDGKQICTK